MKIKRFTGNDVRRVLAAMITNSSVLSHISGAWEPPGLFDSAWANMIGQWCVQYQEKYAEPPGANIQPIFESWAQKATDESTVASVEKFLYTMSDEQTDDRPNTSYLIDLAGSLFDRVKLRAQLDHAETELDQGRILDAYERVQNIRKINLGASAWVNPCDAEDAWAEAFSRERFDPLFKYPGRAGEFISPAYERGKFISFMAPDKTGKSFYLMDAAVRAARRKYKVAYFDSGDMDMSDVLIRLGSRVARHPLEPCVVKIPQEMQGESIVKFKTQEFTSGLTQGMAKEAMRKVFRGNDRLRISCHANSSLTVNDIDGILSDWERDGWVADMVVIDYADILAMRGGQIPLQEKIDDLWKSLRRLSQERWCLVLTATQSAATAYGKSTHLSQSDFSDSKKKLAHVNGMIGINVKDQRGANGEASDKENGITRLNWVVRRKGKYSMASQAICAGALELGCPVIVSN